MCSTQIFPKSVDCVVDEFWDIETMYLFYDDWDDGNLQICQNA